MEHGIDVTGPTWDASHPCGSATGTTVREAFDQMLAYTPACLDEEVAAREGDFRRLFTSVDDLVPDTSLAIVVNAYTWWTGWPDMVANGTPAEMVRIDGSLALFFDGWNAQECAVAAESGFVCVDLYHAFNSPDGISPAGDLLEHDHSYPSRKGNALIDDLLIVANLFGDPSATRSP